MRERWESAGKSSAETVGGIGGWGNSDGRRREKKRSLCVE